MLLLLKSMGRYTLNSSHDLHQRHRVLPESVLADSQSNQRCAFNGFCPKNAELFSIARLHGSYEERHDMIVILDKFLGCRVCNSGNSCDSLLLNVSFGTS